jgi:hypothetical protein
MDKSEGSSLSFTPDSKHLFLSSLRVGNEYYLYSDLGVYDLDQDSVHWITHGLRARDPDVSKDGKWVTFTLTQKSTTFLARAPLIEKNGEYKLGRVEKLFLGEMYDHVANPKYSRDGNQIYFAFHKNGNFSEEIAEYSLATQKVSTLVSNGHFNHYPTVDPQGALYFISDMTGTENLFKFQAGHSPALVSNLTTGVEFPAIAPNGDVYAAVLSYTGYDLAKIKNPSAPIDAQAVSFGEPLFPQPDADSEIKPPKTQYKISDYSIFPSIWPRQWSPILVADSTNELYVGGEVLGFDAADFHQYLLAAATDTLVGKLDYLVAYSNRQLGPTITLSSYNETSNVNTYNGQLYYYQREINAGINLAYSFLWTYSSLTPNFDFNLDRQFLYEPGANPTDSDIVARGPYLPSTDLYFVYTDAETSPLAVYPEKGRTAVLGERVYFDSGVQVYKTLVTNSEYFQLPFHMVANPSIKASWSSLAPSVSGIGGGSNAETVVQGHFPYLSGGLPGSSFSRLPLRGYPGETFYVRSAEIPAFDYVFPLKYLFRGWGTNPLFFNYFSGFGFAEVGIFPGEEPGALMLPSAGGGIRGSLQAFVQLPITVSVEFHNGFRTDLGGAAELFFQMGITGVTF